MGSNRVVKGGVAFDGGGDHGSVLDLFAVEMLVLKSPEEALDEKLALCALLVAGASLAHAFSYTSAEGAHPSKRWLFHRGADVLALIAVYVVVLLWV